MGIYGDLWWIYGDLWGFMGIWWFSRDLILELWVLDIVSIVSVNFHELCVHILLLLLPIIVDC